MNKKKQKQKHKLTKQEKQTLKELAKGAFWALISIPIFWGITCLIIILFEN